MSGASKRIRYAAGALLGVHAALLGLSIPRNSVTIDEVVHLPTGMAYWQRGEFWGYHHNPPLVRLLFAAPAVLLDVPIDYSAYYHRPRSRQPDSDLGRQFMLLNRNHYMLVFGVSRAVVAALSVLGGYFVFRWARELFGDAGGLLSLALWVFCPNVLAHAGLVTPDVGSTVIGFIATYRFWRYLRSPSLERAAWCGVLLGLTQAAKFSFVLLPFVWGVVAVAALLTRRRDPATGAEVQPSDRSEPRSSATSGGSQAEQSARGASGAHSGRIANPSYAWLRAGWHALVVLCVSVVVLNDVYLGEGSGRRLGEFDFRSKALTREVAPADGPGGRLRRENRFRGTALENVPVPLPAHYVLGFDDQMFDVDTGRFYKYLRGELRRGEGWWYYYVYCVLVKTPVGALVLIVGGLAAVAIRRFRVDLVSEAALLLPAIVFFVSISSQTGLNSHLRYVLPAYPFLFVCAGRLGRLAEHPRGRDAEGTGRPDDPAPAHAPSHKPSLARRVGVKTACGAALVLLVATNAASVLRIHPHYLAYFNEPAGGPRNGIAHLADSNIDWGQGLIALQEWLDEHAPGESIRLAYFGTMYPEVLGIEYELPPFGPEAVRTGRLGNLPHDDPAEVGPVPGLQAVGANYVIGVPFPAPNAQGSQTPVPVHAYTYYQRFQPIATPGWSIYVYDLSLEEVNRVRRDMGLPELVSGEW